MVPVSGTAASPSRDPDDDRSNEEIVDEFRDTLQEVIDRDMPFAKRARRLLDAYGGTQ